MEAAVSIWTTPCANRSKALMRAAQTFLIIAVPTAGSRGVDCDMPPTHASYNALGGPSMGLPLGLAIVAGIETRPPPDCVALLRGYG